MYFFFQQLFDLVVIKLSLDVSGKEAKIGVEIETWKGKVRNSIVDWSYTARECGIPEKMTRELAERYSFSPPPALTQQLTSLRASLPVLPNQPLWLYLARPTGYLAMVPWEQWIQPLLDHPVLRLTDVGPLTPAPRLQPKNVVLCSSAPLAKSMLAFDAREFLLEYSKLASESGSQPPTVHVFTDAEVYDQLKSDFQANTSIRMHDPTTAARYDVPEPDSQIAESVGSVQNPWLRWISDELRHDNLQADVVHFINHGYYTGRAGAMAFAESPLHNQDSEWSRFIGAGELSMFLNDVGAATAILTAPPSNYSDVALRMLADDLAWKRFGSVVCHESKLDQNRTAIHSIYEFFFSGSSEAEPPSTPAAAIYTQPYRAAATKSTMQIPDVESVIASSSHQQFILEKPSPSDVQDPAWLATAETYLDQRGLELQQQQQTLQSPQAQAELHSSSETLLKIQSILRSPSKEL